MNRRDDGRLVFSPSDLITFSASPFASWMDRFELECPGVCPPDVPTEEKQLIVETGNQHERRVLDRLRREVPSLVEIDNRSPTAFAATIDALRAGAPIIYQAALQSDRFAGYADFLFETERGAYEVWDTKLALHPKPYYAIQLCGYSEMLAAVMGVPLPARFGVILGSGARAEFRLEDFIHYYRRLKARFLAMQDGFEPDFCRRPAPEPRGEHGRWASYAQEFFAAADHLVQVAGITTGQIGKLNEAGVQTVAQLATRSEPAPKLDDGTLAKLRRQAELQCKTRTARQLDPTAIPAYEVLPSAGPNGEPSGLACLPPPHGADVFFDMEGYPLAAGGLEYLFGALTRDAPPGDFVDWWAHQRSEEKAAFEGFVDWVYARWRANPGMHIFHYAAYEESAFGRLSTLHDTRQSEVDALLTNRVLVDLYRIVRQGLQVGSDNYSIKSIEGLYRGHRTGAVATAGDSIVQYARWIASGEPPDWQSSPVLHAIREYNRDDCRSTAELYGWLRDLAASRGIAIGQASVEAESLREGELKPEVADRLAVVAALRAVDRADPIRIVLADLIDYHRRENKPMWWRMFDRADMTPEELRGDTGCIEGLVADGDPSPVARSLAQRYRFDPSQETKLGSKEEPKVMFTHNLDVKFTLLEIDTAAGELSLKIGRDTLNRKLGGQFPRVGAIQQDEYVNDIPLQSALLDLGKGLLEGHLPESVNALLARRRPAALAIKVDGERPLDAAIRVARAMAGECLVIQGPPGTGKTFAASRMIAALLADGKRVGVTSNTHQVVINLLRACGEAMHELGRDLVGIKAGGESSDALFDLHLGLKHVTSSDGGFAAYGGGVAAGTAWLFSRPEWQGALDYLFVDEAGQVCLANAVAAARCAKNLVLVGDQMQLEQPVEGAHPGDSGLSALQYALKDEVRSRPDAPEFFAVIPEAAGLFLAESRRMHPEVCRFISDSIYEGRLRSAPDCARQRIAAPASARLIRQERGIVFSPVEHEGNVQQCDDEVERVLAIYEELRGREFTDKSGAVSPLGLPDFMFIAPYNAQVRSLRDRLPHGANVGSVDKLQGREAAVCILSLCSSYGEYGSRGLAFILDRNRINVAVSRAKCLAVIVADPRIATAAAGSIKEMKLINLFCKLVDGP